MARARKPLTQQRGDLTEKKKAELEIQEKAIITGRDDLAKPPEWLVDHTAKEEFKRVVKELSKIELVGNLDLAMIGAYANAYSGYVRASRNMKGKNMIVTRTGKGGVTKAKNPLISIQEDYAREMRVFANLCGISIDSRLKAAEAKNAQIEDEMEEKFGDI